MNQQFLRMQQLAGVKPQPTFDDLVIEALTEYHLYVNYYSKGILKENINEGIFTGLKNKLAKTFKGIKPTEALYVTLLAKIRNITKKVTGNDKLFDKIVDYLATKPSKEDLSSWLDKNASLTEAKTIPAWKRVVLVLMTLLIANGAFGKYSKEEIKNSGIKAKSEKTADATQKTPGLDSDPDTADYSKLAQELGVSDSTQDAIDAAAGDTGNNPVYVSDDGKEIKIGFDTGEFRVKNVKDIAKKVYDKIKQAAGGKTIKNLPINKQGLISNLPGENDDDPKGPKKTGLASDRNAETDSVYDEIEALAKADNPNIKMSLVDKGTNVDDLGSEVEKDSDEAKKTQAISLDISDMETEDEKEPEKKDTPKLDNDKALFRAPKLTAPDANKYTVLAAQILPELISDEAYKSFRKNLKLEDNKFSGEVINDDSVAKNIERLKQENTKEAKDAIATLLWLRTIKKSPQTLANEFKKLDPKINLVFQGGLFKPGQKGKAAYRPGSGLAQTPDATRDQTTQLAEIYSSLLLEAQSNFSSLPGYKGDNEVKSKLGYLIPIYVYNWNVEFGEGTFDYIQQGDYAPSFNKFAKDAPVIVQKLSTQYEPKPKDKPTQSTDQTSSTKKTPPDVVRLSQVIGRDKGFQKWLGKIDNVNELSSFILALFLYRDNKGSLFSPDKLNGFDSNAGKVRSALFSLNNKIPDVIQEENEDDNFIRKFGDVKAAYTYIGKSTTLRNELMRISDLPEFHSFILQSILPYINPKFKTKEGVKDLTNAIALAARQTKEFEKLLDKQKSK